MARWIDVQTGQLSFFFTMPAGHSSEMIKFHTGAF